jgi:hypothetical protein
VFWPFHVVFLRRAEIVIKIVMHEHGESDKNQYSAADFTERSTLATQWNSAKGKSYSQCKSFCISQKKVD